MSPQSNESVNRKSGRQEESTDAPLVIDLPDGQKLFVGRIDSGTVIEVATWRGTGRPDSRTNRIIVGMSSGQIQAVSNQNEEVESEPTRWQKISRKFYTPHKKLPSDAKPFTPIQVNRDVIPPVRKNEVNTSESEKRVSQGSLGRKLKGLLQPFRFRIRSQKLGNEIEPEAPDADIEAFLAKLTQSAKSPATIKAKKNTVKKATGPRSSVRKNSQQKRAR